MMTTQYEGIRIKKTDKFCSLCEDYAARQAGKPVLVMSCEGGRLRGEIARQAANILCFELAPEKTARLCLGGAFTKNTGQRALVRNTPKLVAIEGCSIECATRMMKGVVPDIAPQVAIADKLCDFDKRLFGINEMPEEQIRQHAREVATKIALTL
jgi:uncharacterized metal-binding protein